MKLSFYGITLPQFFFFFFERWFCIVTSIAIGNTAKQTVSSLTFFICIFLFRYFFYSYIARKERGHLEVAKHLSTSQK